MYLQSKTNYIEICKKKYKDKVTTISKVYEGSLEVVKWQSLTWPKFGESVLSSDDNIVELFWYNDKKKQLVCLGTIQLFWIS